MRNTTNQLSYNANYVAINIVNPKLVDGTALLNAPLHP